MQMQDNANKDWLKSKKRWSKLDVIVFISATALWSYVLFLIDQEIFK